MNGQHYASETMRNDDGFIYDDSSDFSENDRRVLKGLHQEDEVDPVTGRKAKKKNFLNKKKLTKYEMDEFFLDY